MAGLLKNLPATLSYKLPAATQKASTVARPPLSDPSAAAPSTVATAQPQGQLQAPEPLEHAEAQVVAMVAGLVVDLELERDYELIAKGTKEGADRKQANQEWLRGVCQALNFDPSALPSRLRPDDVTPMLDLISPSTHAKILHLVLLASIFPPPSHVSADSKGPQAGEIEYTATARRRVYALAKLLKIDHRDIVKEEEKVAGELFDMLKQAAAGSEEEKRQKEKDEVERVRKEREEGWGGRWGRWAATGAGVVIGSVALGLTGGLAAPAILALLPTLGFLTPAAAPILLGTFFGLTGGGLAGRRVRRRWGGVGEFEFVEVGREAEKEEKIEVTYAVRRKKGTPGGTPCEGSADVKAADVQRKLEDLKIDSNGPSAVAAKDDTSDLTIPPRPPSLTVLIALPGLLTQSPDEGVSVWSSVSQATRAGEIRQLPATPVGPDGLPITETTDPDDVKQDDFELPEEQEAPVEQIADREGDEGALLLRNRDLFVTRVETEIMFSTGKGINEWVTDKLIKKAGAEVLKRTFINAYMSAVALPLTVYGWAGTALDNTWMRAVDKAKKAGPLLADILLSRTQGSRPVQLVGHSLGALTVLHTLLSLAQSDNPLAKDVVDSAVLISLPASPSEDAWLSARKVVGRRMVNAWSSRDYVLASVVRLHEVIGNAVELRDGLRVGGLAEVPVEGVENVDLSDVVSGHFQIGGRMTDILRRIDLDA